MSAAATRILTMEEVRTLFLALAPREYLIARLAVLAGMRPGEIFGLQWARLEAEYADIRQRVYRGEVDSPKSTHSVRWAALSDGLRTAIQEWRSLSLDTDPGAHSCLLKELDVDPHGRADQMGHTVDVNENVYTQTSLAKRREAVNRLELMLQIN